MPFRLSRRTLLALPLIPQLTSSAANTQAAPPASTEVPMFRGNPGRTGENPGPGPAGSPTARWKARLGTAITSSPSVTDGIIYIGSVAPTTVSGGALHAVDAATGIEIWRSATTPGDGILSSPAVVNGIVVVGSYDGIVIAADASAGEERWRYQTEAGVNLQSPAIVDDVVYLTDSGGHLYALDTADGRERWRFVSGNGSERSFSSPAVANGMVFCVDASRRTGEKTSLHSLDSASGKERWTFTPEDGNDLFGLPVITGSRVFVATLLGPMVAIDAASGNELARYDFDAVPSTRLAVVNNVILLGSDDGQLIASNIETGERLWSRQINDGAALYSGPTIAGGTAYVGDADGFMFAIDAATGAQQWKAGVRSLWSAPTVIDGSLYVGSEGGELRAVGGSDEPKP